jgi:acyl-CoA dehydrogenase
MIVLDERLQALKRTARGLAGEFRDHALELDARPDEIAPFLSLEGVQWMWRMSVPAEHAAAPLRIGPHTYHGTDCLERVITFEQLSYGDAAMTLAAPGPSMSGVIVSELGDDEQRERYYAQILAEPTWTFFALTEPARGSDASALQTALSADGHGGLRLDGCKRYVGNGTRARIGVVFARTRPGPLGIEAALVDTRDSGFEAQPLDMLGLRGARISELRFDGMRVTPDAILGRHLPATRRGLQGAVTTFNRLRPCVAAAALGTAQAAIDYVREQRHSFSECERDTLDDLDDGLAVTRQLIYRAAVEAQADPTRGALASAAKLHAVRIVERATRAAAALLGPGSLLEDPLLEKWLRDARGFEFMEGTTNVQKLNVFQGLNRGQFRDA